MNVVLKANPVAVHLNLETLECRVNIVLRSLGASKTNVEVNDSSGILTVNNTIFGGFIGYSEGKRILPWYKPP